jgi:hypothetical protein
MNVLGALRKMNVLGVLRKPIEVNKYKHYSPKGGWKGFPLHLKVYFICIFFFILNKKDPVVGKVVALPPDEKSLDEVDEGKGKK